MVVSSVAAQGTPAANQRPGKVDKVRIADYRPGMPAPVIEPVRRSFLLLEALSHRRSSTLPVLTGETGLPRPTVVRLLHTLIALGYAARVSRQQGYRLTDRVLGLSESIRFVDHLVDAAIPHMRRFTEDHGWPLYLASLSQGAIIIRHSTAPESPMAFE